VNADGDETSSVIDHQVVGSVVASVAFSQRVQLSLDLPMVLFQATGDAPIAQDASSFALGDVRAATTVALWSSRDALTRSGVAFGLVADVLLPTGASDAFAGEGLRGGGGLVVEAFASDRTRFAAQGTFRAGGGTRVADTRLDQAILWSIAAERRIGRHWAIAADLVGQRWLGDDDGPGNRTPLELLAGPRWHNDLFYWQAAGGLGLTTGVGVPVARGVFSIGVTPRGARWSGIEAAHVEPFVPEPAPPQEPAPIEPVAPPTECAPDRMDACATPPPRCEDDRVLRPHPVCTDEGTCDVEWTAEACEEDRMCGRNDAGQVQCVPRPREQAVASVDEESQQVIITEMITFHFDTADVTRESRHVLDDVASLLLRESRIRRVRVEGHTDNFGTAEYNLPLSDRRAQRVVDELVARGVDRGRLDPVGLGLTRPIDTNATDAGRQRNRRVEFHIEVME
jgi:OOP family OmpA-OmpF porin